VSSGNQREEAQRKPAAIRNARMDGSHDHLNALLDEK
jgi:hypothetical protein